MYVHTQAFLVPFHSSLNYTTARLLKNSETVSFKSLSVTALSCCCSHVCAGKQCCDRLRDVGGKKRKNCVVMEGKR